jgi:hypothetical protein
MINDALIKSNYTIAFHQARLFQLYSPYCSKCANDSLNDSLARLERRRESVAAENRSACVESFIPVPIFLFLAIDSNELVASVHVKTYFSHCLFQTT